MHPHHLPLLCCPKCAGSLSLTSAEKETDQLVHTGTLTCTACTSSYPIRSGVPRFVPKVNYSSSFGFQWNLHFNTQYDSHTGVPVSRDRLFKETRWPQSLEGQKILEVGSGSGRFTEALAATGATVVSIDYSDAVEANAHGNGNKKNVLIVQASIYEMPIRAQTFDKVLCIGVLQHTPDLDHAFRALVGALKAGGDLAIDVYRWRWTNLIWPRYWLRAITKRLPPPMVYA